MILVIIGGASGSGKTGLSQYLHAKLNNSGVSSRLLNMDDYFKEIPKGINIDDFRLNTNFDTPEMLHLDLLRTHIDALNKGNSITKPLFDFKTNLRVGEEKICPSDVIIIEGIFAQYFYRKYSLPELAIVTVNIATENYRDVVERRIKRDIAHRGRSREDCIKQENKYVGPGFLKYTASSSINADVYVCNEHRELDDEQHAILDKATSDIIEVLNKKRLSNQSEKMQTPKVMPSVQEMVAKSHLIAGTLFQPRKFQGYFSGVFGDFKGECVREFSEREENENKPR